MVKLFAILLAATTIMYPVPVWEPAAEDVEAIARTLYGECRGAQNPARERRQRTGMSIQEAVRAANEAGMSYGKYIAAKERGEI